MGRQGGVGASGRRAAGSVLAAWTRALVEAEGAPEPLLRRLGIAPAALAERDARLDHDAACALWRALTDAHPDPLFGVHFAERASSASLGVVGYLAQSSATALEALHRVSAYHRLVKGDGTVEVKERGGEVTVVDMPGPRRAPWPRHLAEAVLFAYRSFIERWTGRRVMPRRVALQHPAPRARALCERAFGAPARFSAPRNQIVFAAADLRVPFTTADAALVDLLTPVADRLLHEMPRHDAVLLAVERAVAAELPGRGVSLSRVARRLGLGERTLQRRLRDRSLSFQAIVDGVRRAAASRLIDDPTMQAGEVAFLLGYASASSLRRARKRWDGG